MVLLLKRKILVPDCCEKLTFFLTDTDIFFVEKYAEFLGVWKQV